MFQCILGSSRLQADALIAAGDHDSDNIVIEVHETKWWQKNTEVHMQMHCMLKSSKVMALLTDCLVDGYHGNTHENCAHGNRMQGQRVLDSFSALRSPEFCDPQPRPWGGEVVSLAHLSYCI